MKSFIACFAASITLTATNFALAEQTSNFVSAEQTSNFGSSSKQMTILPSEFSVNEFTKNEFVPVTAGYAINVVNHSNRRACLTTIDANPLVSRGWYIIENGNTGSFNGLSYIRAEECGTGGAVYWNPGWDMQYFCLKYGPAFNIYTPSNPSMCTSLGGEMKVYYRLPSNVTLTLYW